MNNYTEYSKLSYITKILYFGEVVNVDDEYAMGTIRVRINELDNNIDNKELPPCYRLFPLLSYTPQVGERVAILLDRYYNAEKTVNQEKRYWISVGISSYDKLEYDAFETANGLETDGYTINPNPITRNPAANGVYPRRNEFVISGRQNTDIIQRDGEILMRAGKHEIGNPQQLNRRNMAYLQIKHNLKNPAKEKRYETVRQLIEIEPEYFIRAVVNKTSLMIKVLKNQDGSQVELFNNTYLDRESLLVDAKKQIKLYQDKYPKWNFRSEDNDLKRLPTKFPNAVQTITKRVELPQVDATNYAGSVVNLVAEKINLISSKSGEFDLFNPNKQITEDEQLKINTKASPMVKGDKLLEFLDLVKTYMATHTHPFPQMKPTQDETLKKISAFNLESLFNNDIRII